MNTHRRVLHVCPQDSAASRDMEAALTQCTSEIERASDCYAAMAAIVKSADRPFLATVVCLEGLRASEREFFQLIGRRFRTMSVYVYGADSDAISAEWAVHAGAQGRISAEALPASLQATNRSAPSPAAGPASDRGRLTGRLADVPLPPQDVDPPLPAVKSATPALGDAGDLYQDRA